MTVIQVSELLPIGIIVSVGHSERGRVRVTDGRCPITLNIRRGNSMGTARVYLNMINPPRLTHVNDLDVLKRPPPYKVQFLISTVLDIYG